MVGTGIFIEDMESQVPRLKSYTLALIITAITAIMSPSFL